MNILTEPFYLELFNQSLVPMAVLKADTPYFTFVAANPRYCQTVRRSTEELIGKGAFDIFNTTGNSAVQDQFKQLVQGLNQAIENREAVRLPVLRFETPVSEGEPLLSCWQIEITPIVSSGGRDVAYLMCSTNNVTEQEIIRINAEQLRRREQELNEELAATNEEMATTNEELAAANEELITTTEELILSQERLQELNIQLEDRVSTRTRELAESELRLRNLFAQVPLGICVLSGPEFIIELANDNILAIWGHGREVIGGPHSKVRPELEGQSLVELLKQVYATGIPYTGKEVKVHINQQMQHWGYYDFIYQPLKNENDKVTGILIIVDDVTGSVQAKKEQERINEQIRLAKDAASLGMFDMDLTTGTMEWDARCRQLFGITHTNPVSYEHNFLPGLHPDDRERVDHIIQNVFNKQLTNGEYDVEYRTIGAEDGLLRWVRAKGRTFFDEHDKPLRFIGSVIDVTEQVNSHRAAEENERRFRFLLNAMPQQVWTATPDGALNYVNKVVCDDFGYNAQEIVGHGWQEFIHPDDLPGCLNAWVSSLTTGNEYTVEFRLRFSDGQYYWHLARALPFMENGEIVLWVGTNTNIDLQKSNEQKKDEFLSIASHELKTPLTSIKAFNQLMRRTSDIGKLAGFMQKSGEHIQRLERLINDLLDVTKINAGKMVYDMQPFNFKQMLQESVESVQHISNRHQIWVEQSDEVEYTGDRLRLEQVINNFLTNAIKYSPDADKVIVNSRVVEGGLIVSVQDFGIGIPEESLDRLFDRYYRIDNTAMRFEGLGLGLFISSEILKRHQGSFWIESKVGEGSTFYFRLPLVEHTAGRLVTQRERFYQDDTITIIYQGNSCLCANWTGFQTFNSVQQGCMHMLDMIVRHNCSRVLNDNREVLGTWSDASEWVGETFFPLMEKAGITHLAWIFSSSVFSQLSAKKSVDVAVGSITTQFFTDMAQAEEWIHQV